MSIREQVLIAKNKKWTILLLNVVITEGKRDSLCVIPLEGIMSTVLKESESNYYPWGAPFSPVNNITTTKTTTTIIITVIIIKHHHKKTKLTKQNTTEE